MIGNTNPSTGEIVTPAELKHFAEPQVGTGPRPTADLSVDPLDVTRTAVQKLRAADVSTVVPQPEEDNFGSEADVILLDEYRDPVAPATVKPIDPLLVERERKRRQPSEKELFGQLKQGDPNAREKIAERFLPLAYKLAHVYRKGLEPVDDLEQAASIGLLKAIDRFDSSRGCAFSSYAVPTIHGELKRYFRDFTWDLHVPRRLRDQRKRVHRAIDEVEQSQQSWTVSDIAEKLSISEEEVIESLLIDSSGVYKTNSLDISLAEDGDDGTLHDIIGDPNSTDYDYVLQRVDLDAAISKLPPHIQKILQRSLEGWNQREIGEEMGLLYKCTSAAYLDRRQSDYLSY